MLNIHDAEIIRKLFHDSTPIGHTQKLPYLRGKISLNAEETLEAWDAMVAYIEDAEARGIGSENRD